MNELYIVVLFLVGVLICYVCYISGYHDGKSKAKVDEILSLAETLRKAEKEEIVVKDYSCKN